MKKLIFVLAICFIAVPAFAELAVTLVDNEDGTVNVNYTGADANDANIMPRAFALDITIDSPGTITDVSGYKNDWAHDANGEDEIGESNSQYPGFGIYPARIKWWLPSDDDTCDVNNWGTPLADDINDPGAGEGLNNDHIVLEFASLYYAKVNAPPSEGTLCILHYDCGGEPTQEGLNIHMTDEDTYRGGLVFENGDLGDIDVNEIVCQGGCDEPIPPTTPTPTNGAIGVSVYPTKPTLSWSPAAGGVNPRYDVYFGTEVTPVVVVSPNQTATSYLASTAVQGKTYYWKIVAKNDCNPTGVSGPIWSFDTNCLRQAGVPTAEWNDWVNWGKPSCWCLKRQCRGDVNGTKNIYWVSLADFNLFKTVYNKNDATVTATPNGICADLNHVKNIYRVSLADFNLFKTYYNKSEALTPCCDANQDCVLTQPEKWNFWMN